MKKRKRSLRKPLMLLCCAVALVAISVGATLAYLTDNDAVTNTFTVGQVGISLSETKVDANGKAIISSGLAERVQSNAYHLVPGQTYTKDPTVTMDANSEPAYVRMMVKVSGYKDMRHVFAAKSGKVEWNYTDEDLEGLSPEQVEELWKEAENQYDLACLKSFLDMSGESAWEYCGYTENGTTYTFEFRYKTITTKSASAYNLTPLFTKLTVPGYMTNNDLEVLASPSKIFNGNDYPASTLGTDSAFAINVTAHAIQAAGFTSADDAWDAFDAQMVTLDNPEFKPADGEASNVLDNE